MRGTQTTKHHKINPPAPTYFEYDEKTIKKEILEVALKFRPNATHTEADAFYDAFFEGYISKTPYSCRRRHPVKFVKTAFETMGSNDRDKINKLSELAQRVGSKPELYKLLGLPIPKPYSQDKDEKYEDMLEILRELNVSCTKILRKQHPRLYSRLTHYGWLEKAQDDLGIQKVAEYRSVEFLYDFVKSKSIRDWRELKEKHVKLFSWAIKMLQPALVTHDLQLTDRDFLVTTYADHDGAIDFIKRHGIASAKECKEKFYDFWNKIRYSGVYISVSVTMQWPDSLNEKEFAILDAIRENRIASPAELKEFSPRFHRWVSTHSSLNALLERKRPSFAGKKPSLPVLLEALERLSSDVKKRKFCSINQLRATLPGLHKEAVKLKIFGHLAYRTGLKLESQIPSTILIEDAVETCSGDIRKLQQADPFLYALIRKRGLMLNVERYNTIDTRLGNKCLAI